MFYGELCVCVCVCYMCVLHMFYGKLTGTTTPKILSVSPLTAKEHLYKVKKHLQDSSFHK